MRTQVRILSLQPTTLLESIRKDEDHSRLRAGGSSNFHAGEIRQTTGRFWFRRNHESRCCNRRLIGWPPKKPLKQTEGNNIVEFAPSVAEADATLAKFGYTESRELAAA